MCCALTLFDVSEIHPSCHAQKRFSCYKLPCRAVCLYLLFELVAGVKRNNPSCFDGNSLTGSWVSAGPRCFSADLEITEPRDFDVVAIDQIVSDQVKKGVNHVF